MLTNTVSYEVSSNTDVDPVAFNEGAYGVANYAVDHAVANYGVATNAGCKEKVSFNREAPVDYNLQRSRRSSMSIAAARMRRVDGSLEYETLLWDQSDVDILRDMSA